MKEFMEEPEWMETEGEKMAKVLPESPASVNIVYYIDGFRAQSTIRGINEDILVDKIEKFVKLAKLKGWQPSWNTETNKSFEPAPKPSVTSQAGECLHANAVEKISSGANKPENKGKAYKSCTDCRKFLGWS